MKVLTIEINSNKNPKAVKKVARPSKLMNKNIKNHGNS